jgi:CRISPR/Cas system-associated exonuclease Cas4 (RecB family)
MQLVPIRNKFVYPKLQRLDLPTGRVYSLDGNPPVPSVTTILSSTKDKVHLDDWANRVGQEEAERTKNEASLVGTHMHNVVERLLLNRPLETPRTWLQVRGYRMGYTLIEKFFPHVDEAWGTEIPLIYPGRYAGTSDFIGVYKGKPCIVDFKQTNKMKRRAWIEDYFVQLAAYAVAHNHQHGTEINQGVILMVSQEGEVQEFVSVGREFDGYCDQWWRRVVAHEKKGPDLSLGQSTVESGEPLPEA